MQHNNQQQYVASVVTPFHNADMELFLDCAHSMIHQTVGFRNMEWIIVLHNCDPGYKEQLTKLFCKNPNVVLAELNNDARTPSSPRNYGTRLATAPYVGYLDADDQYLPDCIERTVREAQTTGADVVWFRRETTLPDPAMRFISVASNWDCTQERIVIDRAHWDADNILFGAYGFVTSYLFNRNFLASNQLQFHEEVLYAEDFLFMAEVALKAQKICYLPQFKGYRYVINSGSLVQNHNKQPDVLLRYVEGFLTLFDAVERNGVDSTLIKFKALASTTNFVLGSHLTTEHRQRIKALLEPHVASLRIMPPNKFMSQKAQNALLQLIRFVILHPDDPYAEVRRAQRDGDNELIRILRENATTDFGRRYGFEAMGSVDDYQRAVPLSAPESYKPLVELQAHVGEFNVLTTEKNKRYLLSPDGTLAACPPAHLTRYAKELALTLNDSVALVLARCQPPLRQTYDEAEVDTLQSAVLKDYFANHHFAGGTIHCFLANDIACHFLPMEGHGPFADMVEEALSREDLKQIVAFRVEDVETMLNTLFKHAHNFYQTIRDRERRNEVFEIFRNLPQEEWVENLWPNLQRIVAPGAVGNSTLQQYAGNVALNNGCLMTEATIVGRAVADNSPLYETLEDCNFHELLPLTPNASPIPWSQATLGEPYRLVVTNHAGLYRCTTPHIVVPQEVAETTVRFTIDTNIME